MTNKQKVIFKYPDAEIRPFKENGYYAIFSSGVAIGAGLTPSSAWKSAVNKIRNKS